MLELAMESCRTTLCFLFWEPSAISRLSSYDCLFGYQGRGYFTQSCFHRAVGGAQETYEGLLLIVQQFLNCWWCQLQNWWSFLSSRIRPYRGQAIGPQVPWFKCSKKIFPKWSISSTSTFKCIVCYSAFKQCSFGSSLQMILLLHCIIFQQQPLPSFDNWLTTWQPIHKRIRLPCCRIVLL